VVATRIGCIVCRLPSDNGKRKTADIRSVRELIAVQICMGHVAGIAASIAVGVKLIRVWNAWAIVVVITNTVAVPVVASALTAEYYVASTAGNGVHLGVGPAKLLRGQDRDLTGD